MKSSFLFILIVAIVFAAIYLLYQRGVLDPMLAKWNLEDDPAPAVEGTATKQDESTQEMDTTLSSVADSAGPGISEEELERQYPMPNFKPLEVIVDNWNRVPERAFPEVVTARVPVVYKLIRDGREIGSSTSPAGSEVIPLKHKPGQLLVTDDPRSSMQAVLNVDDTDFKERIQAMYDERVTEARNRVLSARKVAREVAARPVEANAPQVIEDGWHDPLDPRFDPVRQFLGSGKLASGKLEEAKRWRWLGTEMVGGRSYEVVLVDFEVETIFGKFPNTMKCLLENGKVVKWIDAETGEERN